VSDSDHPKPIEGHLAAIGFSPSRLTDRERYEIAQVIVCAYVYGNGLLTYDRSKISDRAFECMPPQDVRVVT
jgi:hypothetical protein